jgi:hypothetical protein
MLCIMVALCDCGYLANPFIGHGMTNWHHLFTLGLRSSTLFLCFVLFILMYIRWQQ